MRETTPLSTPLQPSKRRICVHVRTVFSPAASTQRVHASAKRDQVARQRARDFPRSKCRPLVLLESLPSIVVARVTRTYARTHGGGEGDVLSTHVRATYATSGAAISVPRLRNREFTYFYAAIRARYAYLYGVKSDEKARRDSVDRSFRKSGYTQGGTTRRKTTTRSRTSP